MTVRGKIFIAMAVLVALVSAAYVGTTQGYLGSLFFRYSMEDGPKDIRPEQLKELSGYIMDRMRLKAVSVTLFVAGIAAIICYWLSGMLIRPLNKLIGVMESVAARELDVEVPVRRRDEYGQAGEVFNKMSRNLREAENGRKRLVEDVAHELRTPLSIVLSRLELFQQSATAVKPESLLPLHDEVLRLIQLVDELQLLTSAEAGELVLHREWTDVRAFLSDLTELVQAEAEACGIRMAGPHCDKVLEAYIDRRRMKQVVLNLVANALRYTPHGGEIGLLVSTAEDPAFIAITVKDTGPGIAPDELPYLFDRFYRGKESERRSSGGAGLGLAISRQIAIAHGGYMEVKNNGGGGASFSVILPCSGSGAEGMKRTPPNIT